ncbi:hypothetical protein M569_17288 [Genlisea aurea]|uniref:Uncharacterized protein n=1 Tax=Genlisea aurea TaxID=192259 RepID=S8BT09_9LAMI|nr:hypothetical protein M569_17288 [Genlisea aurea]
MQIARTNFSKEDRKKVPRAVKQKIASLNGLDMKLYNYAKKIFAENQDAAMHHNTLPVCTDEDFLPFNQVATFW